MCNDESRSAREVRHAAQHRLTDQMRSDELLLKRLETSQQRGVLRKSQVRPPSRSALPSPSSSSSSSSSSSCLA